MKGLGFIVTFALLVGWSLIGGPIEWLWNGTALCYVLVASLSLFMSVHGAQGFTALLRLRLSSGHLESARRKLEFARGAQFSFCAIGVVGTLIQVVMLIPKSGDPTAWAPGLYMVPHPILYGAVLALAVNAYIVRPLRMKCL